MIRPSEAEEVRESKIQQHVQIWHRSRAIEHFQEKLAWGIARRSVWHRLEWLQGVSGLAGVRVKDGECGIQAKHDQSAQVIADYVVIHEMRHMIHLHYPSELWQLLGPHHPTYTEPRQWLWMAWTTHEIAWDGVWGSFPCLNRNFSEGSCL